MSEAFSQSVTAGKGPQIRALFAKWDNCRACPLCEHRHRIVHYRGIVPCEVLFIGEAPGTTEDTLGLPFTGDAGFVLQNIIEDTLFWIHHHPLHKSQKPRDYTYAITNLVCCLPLDELRSLRQPTDAEITACSERLYEFIKIAKPKLVVLVGDIARRTNTSFFTDRYSTIDIIHPAALLRQEADAAVHGYKKCLVQITKAVKLIVFNEGKLKG